MQDSNLRMHESKSCALPTWLIPSIYGERTGIRTPDTRLRRALLYPAELWSRDNQMERVKGIEPSQPAWKAGTLPLSYTRILYFGGGWWIRTTESIANRFTVCPLWPLGKSS